MKQIENQESSNSCVNMIIENDKLVETRSILGQINIEDFLEFSRERPLIIHVHGGLVSEEDGESLSQRLGQ